jgi:DNA replication and repair protein RecF
MILLQKDGDKRWLDVLERKIAELGVSIAIARNETVGHLNRAISLGSQDFIKTTITIIGPIEELAKIKKSLEVEELFVEKLKETRGLDRESGRNLFGIHRSDFTAILLNKDIMANLCSTGEQKSILIAITIARVRINSFFNLPQAILLLDEIVSHLDLNKRIGLFNEIHSLDAKSFLTGTNKDIFSNLDNISSKNVGFLEIT